MAKLGDLIVRVGVDTRGLNDKLRNVKKEMRETTGQLTQMGKSLSMSLTAPLLGLGALAVKAATDFEFSMAKVQAVSGFTAVEMGRLEKQAQELGASTSRSASDVSSLQLELAKLGKTSTEIEQMTEGVLSLSVAFDQELGESARVVGATLNQFDLEASETNRIVDNMAVLFGSTSLDLEKFDTAMRSVGPVAQAMGISVEEAGAALGILVSSGTDASTAGTALTKSLTTLAQEGVSGADAIAYLTDNNLSVAEAFEMFGDRAGKIIPVLQNASEKFDTLTQKQIEGSGAALEARKILEETAMGGFDRLRSSVEALGISMGDALLPLVNKMTDAIAGFASRLAGMSNGAKTAVVVISAMAAAIGPLLVILPTLVNGLKLARAAQLKLNIAVLANPYVAAAAALMLVVTAAYALSKSTKDAKQEVANLRSELAGLETDKAKREESLKQVQAATAAYEQQKNAVEGVRKMMRVGDAMDQKMQARLLVREQEKLKLKQEIRDASKKEHEALLKTQQAAAELAKTESTKTEPAVKAVTAAIQEQGETLGMLINRLEETNVAAGKAEDPKALGGLINMLEETQVAAYNAGTAIGEVGQETKTVLGALADSADSFGAIIGESFGSMISGAKSGKEAMKDMAKSVIMAALAASQAQIIQAAIGAGKDLGPGALIAIPAFIGAGIALVGSLFNDIPAFKDGGIVSGPTLGLVGEYPGASTNPEVIAPLDKLRSMLGGQNVMVTGKISGRDILLTSERNAIDRNRVRGF